MCPVCASSNLAPSKSHRFFDRFMRLLGQRPLRCRDCNARFYRAAQVAEHIRESRKWARSAERTAAKSGR